jgi:hypothetical protein
LEPFFDPIQTKNASIKSTKKDKKLPLYRDRFLEQISIKQVAKIEQEKLRISC